MAELNKARKTYDTTLRRASSSAASAANPRLGFCSRASELSRAEPPAAWGATERASERPSCPWQNFLSHVVMFCAKQKRKKFLCCIVLMTKLCASAEACGCNDGARCRRISRILTAAAACLEGREIGKPPFWWVDRCSSNRLTVELKRVGAVLRGQSMSFDRGNATHGHRGKEGKL